jgi:hypothetical protein
MIMGLFRIVLRADDYDGVRPNGANRGTVHGSHSKAALTRIGGRVMGGDAKPSGFFRRSRPAPDRGGRP